VSYKSMVKAIDRLTEEIKRFRAESEEGNDSVCRLLQSIRQNIAPVDRVAFGLSLKEVLALPKQLFQTFVTLNKLGGRATASEIAENTEKRRAVESGYLNQLLLMGYVQKERDGRKVVFTVAGRRS